ncbi:MAG: ATP-binding protein [Gammaproteobacteria bacterium]
MDRILRYLLLIRLCAVGGLCLGLAVMDAVYAVEVPWFAVSIVLVLLGVVTLLGWRGATRLGAAPHHGYLAQLMADMVALSALVYFTGGAFNPFISLFLLPIVFAAAALPAPATAALTVLAIGCYTALMLAPVRGAPVHHEAGLFGLHVWGMWYGFILSALCVALFVAGLARHVRARDRELAALREEALESERYLALGTLAAGTAHELGTPLSTMAVLAGELADTAESSEARAQITLLRDQIARCKDILATISADAGNLQAGAGEAIGVDAYLDGIIAEWRARRPEIRLAFHGEGPRPAPEIVADRVLTQAIVNVIDNAAQAAATQLAVDGRWSRNELVLTVVDDGTGIAPEIGARLGREAVTTKEDGLGIGLLLARSIVERLGGVLEFSARAERGTTARIAIPLAGLSVA